PRLQPVISARSMYGYDRYGFASARTRAEKGLGRTHRPVDRRDRATARLRDRQAHRGAVRWRARVPRRLAVPAAVPARGARLAEGSLDRAAGRAPAALLLADRGRPPHARAPARDLEALRALDVADHRGRAWLIGARRCARGSRAWPSTRRTRPRSSRRSRPTW